MSITIKICGITNSDDLKCAVDEGADIIGFILAESPRRITHEKCFELRQMIPEGVSAAGVFVDEATSEVHRIADMCALDYVQFHGTETPDYCREFGTKAVKAFRVENEEDLHAIPEYGTDLFLLDTFVKGVQGGTGKTFAPDIAVAAKKYGDFLMAGGLTPDNIQDIITQVQPWGVDVSSGVEKDKGIKDHSLVRKFIRKVKELQ